MPEVDRNAVQQLKRQPSCLLDIIHVAAVCTLVQDSECCERHSLPVSALCRLGSKGRTCGLIQLRQVIWEGRLSNHVHRV